MPRRPNKSRQRRLARERMSILLELSERASLDDIELAERYGDLARRISMRCRVPIPREWKWRYCKRCKRLLFPGITAIVRTSSKQRPHLIIRCTRCGSVNRRPLTVKEA